MITQSFREDLIFFEEKIRKNEPFALLRFGDGEYKIINDEPIDLLAKKEFKYNGESQLRIALRDSFECNLPNYYIGIACACCAGNRLFSSMLDGVKVPGDQLTWANIFVNANFHYLRSNFFNTLRTKKINLIAPGNHENLDFPILRSFRVGTNAWIEQDYLIEDLMVLIEEKSIMNEIFLFCAGPFSNILCYNLFKRYPQNIYIDFGSVLNVELGIGANRKYLRGKKNIHKVCNWKLKKDAQKFSIKNFISKFL